MNNPNALGAYMLAEAEYLRANGWEKIATKGEIRWYHPTFKEGRRQKNAVIYQRYIDLNGYKIKVEKP